MPPHAINWAGTSQVLANYWGVGAGILGVLAWLVHTHVAHRVHLFVDGLRSAHTLSLKIETLSAQLEEAEDKADDWQQRFTEVERRYDALNIEWHRLGEDIRDLHKRMTTAESNIHQLRHDRDALIDYSRLLIGQMFQAGLTPDCRPPALKSIITIPGPPLPPYPGAEAGE